MIETAQTTHSDAILKNVSQLLNHECKTIVTAMLFTTKNMQLLSEIRSSNSLSHHNPSPGALSPHIRAPSQCRLLWWRQAWQYGGIPNRCPAVLSPPHRPDVNSPRTPWIRSYPAVLPPHDRNLNSAKSAFFIAIINVLLIRWSTIAIFSDNKP